MAIILNNDCNLGKNVRTQQVFELEGVRRAAKSSITILNLMRFRLTNLMCIYSNNSRIVDLNESPAVPLHSCDPWDWARLTYSGSMGGPVDVSSSVLKDFFIIASCLL